MLCKAGGLERDDIGQIRINSGNTHVELTPQGQVLEISARRMVGQFDDLVDDFRGYATLRKGRVSIAALPSIASGSLL